MLHGYKSYVCFFFLFFCGDVCMFSSSVNKSPHSIREIPPVKWSTYWNAAAIEAGHADA